MSKRLPSLNALRVFVVVARHGGVSRASEVLNLTHSAVSHQIRILQQELGITLFDKAGRGLALTTEGSRFAQRVELQQRAVVHGDRQRGVRRVECDHGDRSCRYHAEQGIDEVNRILLPR